MNATVPDSLEHAIALRYRLRVLEAAQKALAARGGLSKEALGRLATRGRVDAADVLRTLKKVEEVR